MSADYASFCIKGVWPEAEDVIATNAFASLQYAKRCVVGRWEKGEQAMATDANVAYAYAREVTKCSFVLGEPAIATSAVKSVEYAQSVLKNRFPAGEAAIAKMQTANGDVTLAKRYYELFMQTPESWSDWTIDQLKVCPCWMYMYAKDCLKGRLPDLLHNHMLTFGMTLKEDYYVKKYFKAKRYQKKVKYRRKKKHSTLAEAAEASLIK